MSSRNLERLTHLVKSAAADSGAPGMAACARRGGEEIAASPFRDRTEQPLEQIDMDHDFMSDAAAVIRNVDLVVAPENYAAHLAGALGKPVFTALTVSPSWYWLLAREDSIWYPTMRLFRQPKHGEWNEVFQRIAKAAAEIQPQKPTAKLPGLGG